MDPDPPEQKAKTTVHTDLFHFVGCGVHLGDDNALVILYIKDLIISLLYTSKESRRQT